MPKTTARLLTDKDVRSAKAAPGQRLELWDSRAPGLCLRVTAKGSKTWVVRYRTLDGRQPRFTLGPAGSASGDLSLVEARDRASDVRRLAREGGDPATTKRQEAAEAMAVTIRTMDDLAESYFTKSLSGAYRATRSGKKAETVAAERRLWNFRLKPRLGRRPVEAVNRAELRGLLADISEAAPIQSNRALALVRSMFNFAVHEERLTVSPVVGIKAIAEEVPRDRILTDAELAALWAGLEDPTGLKVPEGDAERTLWVSEQVRIALRLSLLTLQRRTEIAEMRVDELRLDESTWLIGKERTKNGKAHLVPLSPPAVELIKRALALHATDESSQYVFPSTWKKLDGQPIGAGALSHALSDVYAALKIGGANLHDLRRTGASAMASERLLVAPIVISRVLNHTVDGGGGAAVTQRHYAIHDYAKEKRTAMDAWARLLNLIVHPAASGSNISPLHAA